VNALTLGALLGLLIVAHEWLLFDGAAGAGHESYLQLIVLAQCGFAVATAAVLSTMVAPLRHAVFGLSLTIAPLLYVDALVRARIDRHLTSVAGMLLDLHFAENRRLLDATGVDARAVVAFALAVAALVSLGAWVDWRTRGVAARVVSVSRRGVLATWIATLLALAGLEAGAGRAVASRVWSGFARRVPQLLGDLAPTPKAKTSFRARLRPRRSEAELADAIARVDMPAAPPPGDVFFIVIDSLRADAVGPSTTPALDQLARDALRAKTAVSGGDMTHVGWYPLFWSNPALYWRLDPDREDRGGAVPLRLARRRGWRIEMLASADPRYLNIDRAILGADRQLADRVVDLHALPGTVADHDAAVMRELLARVGVAHPPTIYLVALDSVHLPYVWADAFVPPYVPYADINHYLRLEHSASDQEAIKNRYRNAVSFVDSLVAPLFAALRAEGMYEESTLVVVGDHGEEFWEHSVTGHGLEPCGPETHVAFSLKPPKSALGNGDWSSPKPFASTMDVWPTILDAAGVRGVDESLFSGASLLREPRRAALVTHPRYLASPPARFVLDDGKEKVIFELSQPDRPFQDQDLFVVELLDENDMPIREGLTASDYNALVRRWFGGDLDRFFAVRW
jgi:hypothetical protein